MSDTSRSRLKVSREGIVLIKSFEGFRPRAVQTDAGGWTIGYGHTASAREGATVGESDAELLLQYDLLPVAKALNDDVSVVLNQHQFDALASFAVSVGVAKFLASDVLQRLNAGAAGEAADALMGWPRTPDTDAALRRRAAERALFVADPSRPVHLADLLAAPLPPPTVAVVESEIIRPDFAMDARAAAVASLLGEEPPQTAAQEPAEPAEVNVEADPMGAAASALRPMSFPPRAAMRYSPYATAMVGPLPGFPPTESTVVAAAPAEAVIVPIATEAGAEEEPEPDPTPAPEPEPEQAPEPEPEPAPAQPAPTGRIDAAFAVTPLVPPPPSASPFPDFDAPLVLTPAIDADFAPTARPVWPAHERTQGEGALEPILFDDEPTLSVLRHESEPVQPRRFDWSETGAFLIMGGVGLAACAASAAAFRLAVTEPSDMGETTVIAWALALIGAICVGVSSWNLYVRWGKAE